MFEQENKLHEIFTWGLFPCLIILLKSEIYISGIQYLSYEQLFIQWIR